MVELVSICSDNQLHQLVYWPPRCLGVKNSPNHFLFPSSRSLESHEPHASLPPRSATKQIAPNAHGQIVTLHQLCSQTRLRACNPFQNQRS